MGDSARAGGRWSRDGWTTTDHVVAAMCVTAALVGIGIFVWMLTW